MDVAVERRRLDGRRRRPPPGPVRGGRGGERVRRGARPAASGRAPRSTRRWTGSYGRSGPRPPRCSGAGGEARRAAVAALRSADPSRPLTWVEAPLKPATLATTRLAEHWAHALDITGPLGIDLPDTDRLRHVAWLAHRSLPYALALSGGQAHDVFCELTAPNGADVWTYGPAGAESSITGPAGRLLPRRRATPHPGGVRPAHHRPVRRRRPQGPAHVRRLKAASPRAGPARPPIIQVTCAGKLDNLGG